MDINQKIADNVGLVYQQLHRFNLINDQDAESFAYEALYRAVTTYDASYGNAFSTYGVCVIANELRRYLRTVSKKRQLEIVSYDAPLSEDTDQLTLVDTLCQAECTESTVLLNEFSDAVRVAAEKIYDAMSDHHKKVISLWYESDGKMKQTEIAKATKLSQSIVSRVISGFKYKLKVELEEYL